MGRRKVGQTRPSRAARGGSSPRGIVNRPVHSLIVDVYGDTCQTDADGDEYFYTTDDAGEFPTCASQYSNFLSTLKTNIVGQQLNHQTCRNTNFGRIMGREKFCYNRISSRHHPDWGKIGSGADGWNEAGTEAAHGTGNGIVGIFYRYVWDCERPDDYCAASTTYDCRNIIPITMFQQQRIACRALITKKVVFKWMLLM